MQTIIGAGGTIGNPLAKALKKYTSNIRLVSRNPEQVNSDDELISADVTDPAALKKAVEGSEIVYCTIGFPYSTKSWTQTWPTFAKNLTEACVATGSKLVFFDNVYMYHSTEIPHMTETSKRDPVSEKGKIREEVIRIIEAAATQGLQYIIARSADFYGPENRQSVLVETVLKNHLKGKKAQWLGRSDKIHTYTYTPDAAIATAMLGNATDTWNQVWHLPTIREPLTGKDWVKLFSAETGAGSSIQLAPVWLVSVMGLFMPIMREVKEMMYQNTQDYIFDSSKFEKRFPDFKITSAEEGIRETVHWFREHPMEI